MQERIKFVYVVDVYNDEKWQKLVKSLVGELIQPQDRVGLIGHFKDSFVLLFKVFP